MSSYKSKWYAHGTKTGWSKDQIAATRRRHLWESTDERKSKYNRLLEAGRRIQALANVHKDPETKRKARADAKHFYGRARALREVGET
jgi:hypothetical protein